MNTNSALRRIALLVAMIALMLIMTSAVPASAYLPGQDGGLQVYDPEGRSNDNTLELGVEWVNNYNGFANNLSATDNDAQGLVNQLQAYGATTLFNWGDNNAWETDWKAEDKAGHGNELNWIDRADLAYFSGHGNSSGFYFGSTHDDHQVSYNDCNWNGGTSGWGRGDLDWVGLSACQTMSDASLTPWARCMNGVRLIMGFKTTMTDTPNFGNWLGYYLRYNYSFQSAFFNSVYQDQPYGSIARILAEDSSYFSDRLYNHNSATTVDNYYSYTTYTKTAAANQAESPSMTASEMYQLLAGEMPVFPIQSLDATQAEAHWQQLLSTFGLTTRQPSAPETTEQFLDSTIRATGDHSLIMDTTTGMFGFTNSPATSVYSTPGVATNAARAPDVDYCAIASGFLSTNNLLPQGASCGSIATLGVAEGNITNGAVVQEATMAYQVPFTRTLTYTPPGNAATATFNIVGPGAKILLDVSATAQVQNMASPQALLPGLVGVSGGFHDVLAPTGNQALATVLIINEAQATLIFNSLEPQLAIGYTPVDYTSRSITGSALAYYEQSMGETQTEEIPVYNFQVIYNQADGGSINGEVYIPSNSTYMVPLAVIDHHLVPSVISEGQHVTLSALDASKTLAELGYDASLNFTPGTGTAGSYQYNWYLGSTAGTKIGTGLTLDYTVPAPSTDPHGSNKIVFVLEVIDSLSTRANNSATATYAINMGSVINLPLVRK